MITSLILVMFITIRSDISDEFIFETPFTKKDGTSQTDELSEQYKKKTILKTSLTFPYLKKRLPIIEKQEVQLPCS